MFYLGRLDDSDGNDNTVFDVIVEADSKDSALDKMWVHVKESYPDDEDDGSYGTYHQCDCECEHGVSPYECDDFGDNVGGCGATWECSHGGVTLSEDPEAFPDYDSAKAAGSIYHRLIDLTEVSA